MFELGGLFELRLVDGRMRLHGACLKRPLCGGWKCCLAQEARILAVEDCAWRLHRLPRLVVIFASRLVLWKLLFQRYDHSINSHAKLCH